MNDLLILFPLLLILAACGNKPQDVIKAHGGPRNSTTDSAFYPYIREYESWYTKYHNGTIADVSHIPINFGDVLQSTTAAQCMKYTNGSKEIIVNRNIWNSYKFIDNPDFKKILVFHELGHCHRNRDHLNDVFGRYNLSFMNAHPFVPINYEDLFEGYMEEFYTKDTEVVKATIMRADKFAREIEGETSPESDDLVRNFGAWLDSCSTAKKQFINNSDWSWDLTQVEEAMRQC